MNKHKLSFKGGAARLVDSESLYRKALTKAKFNQQVFEESMVAELDPTKPFNGV